MKILVCVKRLFLLFVIAFLIILIGNCHFTKRKLESCELIERVEDNYVEAFENYKYCIRPMFAADHKLALRLWQREMSYLSKKCDRVVKTSGYASEDIKNLVRDLIGAMSQFETELRCCESVDRAGILRMVNKMDKKYELFASAAEEFDCFVVRVSYCDEYK